MSDEKKVTKHKESHGRNLKKKARDSFNLKHQNGLPMK